MDFYAQVDKLLKEQKMSRRQLAIKTGIPESTMSTAFMRKSLRFSELNKEKIAAALGVPWWELAGLPVEEIDGQKRVRRLDLEEKMLANYEKFHGKETTSAAKPFFPTTTHLTPTARKRRSKGSQN